MLKSSFGLNFDLPFFIYIQTKKMEEYPTENDLKRTLKNECKEMLKSSSKLNFATSFGICVQRGKTDRKERAPKQKNRIFTTKNHTDMKKSAKTAIRNNNANNVKTVVVRTLAPKANNNDIEEVIETVVENGVNYGSPNIKMMNVITIFKNGDYNTEQHFYINGYKFV